MHATKSAIPVCRFSEKPTVFRVINVGSLAGFTLTLPGAKMTPITLDGGYAIDSEPSESIGILYPGERVDFKAQWQRNVQPGQLGIDLDNDTFRYPNPALTRRQKYPVILRSQSPDMGQTLSRDKVDPILSFFDLTTANNSEVIPAMLPEADETLVLIHLPL